MSKFWSAIVNAVNAAFVACFIIIQTDEYGHALTDGYMGLHIALLACIAMMIFNLFRAMQVAVYGEDF